MNQWGRATYGDPCRECGYDWPNDLDAAADVVRQAPDRMRAALAGSDGTAHAPGLDWDARAYVCHVADNLRIWAERLIAAIAVPEQPIGTYDEALLAVARNYGAIPVHAALWSLERAVTTWLAAVEASRRSEVTLLHPDRGRLCLADVMSANAHDAYHHAYDVRRSIV